MTTKRVETHTIRRGALRFATQISPLLNLVYEIMVTKRLVISKIYNRMIPIMSWSIITPSLGRHVLNNCLPFRWGRHCKCCRRRSNHFRRTNRTFWGCENTILKSGTKNNCLCTNFKAILYAYSGDLNTVLGWFSDGRKLSNGQKVQFF